MVDIVQSNNNKLLIRKIGYSAGLESTFSRLKMLVSRYVRDEQITDKAWKDLVSNANYFNRDISQAKHFENFFEVLEVLSVGSGRPVSMMLLDVLALLYRYYIDDEEKYDIAQKAIMLYVLTMNDGELMCALLSVEFKKNEIVGSLEEYRSLKLSIFFSRYYSEIQRQKLHRVINFEEMPKKPENMERARTLAMGAPPFAGAQKTEREVDITKFEVSLSEDWYKKVPPRRKSWCEDMGLLGDGGITDVGARYLSAMREMLSIDVRQEYDSNEAIVIMPLDIEMISNNTTWSLDDSYKLGFGRIVNEICDVFNGDNVELNALSADILIEEILPFCFNSYVKADIRFTKLRRELPFTVLTLFSLGYCVAERKSMVDIEDVLLSDERNKVDYKMRQSRNSLYGISV